MYVCMYVCVYVYIYVYIYIQVLLLKPDGCTLSLLLTLLCAKVAIFPAYKYDHSLPKVIGSHHVYIYIYIVRDMRYAFLLSKLVGCE